MGEESSSDVVVPVTAREEDDDDATGQRADFAMVLYLRVAPANSVVALKTPVGFAARHQ